MSDDSTHLGINIPTPSLSTEWEGDYLSEQEESNWEQYDKISEAKEANKLLIHRTLGWIIPIALCLAFAGFVTVLGVYVAHLVLPASQRWLTNDELQHIHSMIFSSVVGGSVAVFAKTYFLDSSEKSDRE